MPTLREAQVAIMESLRGCSSPNHAIALLCARDGSALTRIGIYQNNVSVKFSESLRSSYPAIVKLVGEDYFRQIARSLQQTHPSQSGDLLWVGEKLPAYLEQLHANGAYPYLPDVARLEWLCQESLLAADHPSLNLDKLAAASKDSDSVIFVLHPSVRIIHSRFPVLRIWESNVSQADGADEVIDLGSGADRLLLLRERQSLKFHRLNAGEYEFVSGLSNGRHFAAITENCTANSPTFDVTSVLQRFVAIGAIVDCRME